MAIAALYDVHGNLAALEAVLAEIPDGARIVVGGDVCAGGEQPAEALERLRGLGDRVLWVRGNADRELTPGEEGLVPSEVVEPTRAKLSDEQIAFLHERPPSVEIGDVLFVHASPRNDLDVFTALTPDERVAPLFAGVVADLVVCGHTHMQFDREIAGIRVVNAGSVGLPYEDEPGAYWLLIDREVEHRRTTYPDMPQPAASRREATERFEQLAVGA